MNKRILVISDTHCPYHHPDLIPFLKAIKKKYKPDRVMIQILTYIVQVMNENNL